MEAPVAQQPQAAGICSDVAADVARALGPEVEREDITPLGEVLVRCLEDDAGVEYERAADLVEGADLVQARQTDDNLVENGHRAADQARVAALGTTASICSLQ